jgi:hypothetical protein
MKRFLLILIVAGSLVACKKNSTTPTTTTVSRGIAGWWELRRTSGGLRPDLIYASGNGNIYEFNSNNNTYKKYQASLLVAQGTFRIVDNLGPAENGIILIYFDSSTTGEQLQYDSRTLTIGTSAADGPAWTYQKISN